MSQIPHQQAGQHASTASTAETHHTGLVLNHRVRSPEETEVLTVHPMPSHWRTPRGTHPLALVQRALFTILCLGAHGHVGLEPFWVAIRRADKDGGGAWVEARQQLCERLNNMLIVGSLLLASSATFITTVSPAPAIVNYTLRGPYICFICAAALQVVGIIGAANGYLIAAGATATWVERVLYSDRFNVYGSLILASYPFYSIGAGTMMLTVGFTAPILAGEDHALQALVLLIGFIALCVLILLFVVLMRAAAPPYANGQQRADNTEAVGL
ncbi:hypothetical protein C8R46DRAFT_1059503 [Mycena filopes]|nr:hypothetical protein C8R46DRAFT_1059503 [Mycena filopes]